MYSYVCYVMYVCMYVFAIPAGNSQFYNPPDWPGLPYPWSKPITCASIK